MPEFLRKAAAIEVASLDLKEPQRKKRETPPKSVMIVSYACPLLSAV